MVNRVHNKTDKWKESFFVGGGGGESLVTV